MVPLEFYGGPRPTGPDWQVEFPLTCESTVRLSPLPDGGVLIAAATPLLFTQCDQRGIMMTRITAQGSIDWTRTVNPPFQDPLGDWGLPLFNLSTDTTGSALITSSYLYPCDDPP